MPLHHKKQIRFLRWLKILVIIYCVIGVALYFLQDTFLFHPTPLPADYAFNFHIPFKEVTVQYDSITSFNIVRFKPNDSIKQGAVIYCHGNMENINHYAAFAGNFTKHGYEVWMMDYPSFGKSTGQLTEDIMYTEALEVYKIVRAAGYASSDIIIYGKSLGTGVAAQLASIRDCKRLILETPYYSIPNLMAHFAWMYPVGWLSRYSFPVFEYLPKVTAHITIFHGTDDGTIPFSNAKKLQSKLKPGDELIRIEGGHHNNLNDFPLMQQKLNSLLDH